MGRSRRARDPPDTAGRRLAPGFYRPSFVLEIDGDETSVGRSWRATFYIELVEFVTRERN